MKRFDVRGFDIAHAGSVNDAICSSSEQRVATAGGELHTCIAFVKFIFIYVWDVCMYVGDGLVKFWDPRDVKRLQGHTSEGAYAHTYIYTYIHTYIHTVHAEASKRF